MRQKIRFILPILSERLFVALVVNRPKLEEIWNKSSLSSPTDYCHFRVSLAERDASLQQLEKQIKMFGGETVSRMPYLGVITCRIDSERLQELAENNLTKWIDLCFPSL